MQVQPCFRFTNCKLGKALDRDVLPFPELIPVPIKHNEQILIQPKLAPALLLIQRIELPWCHTMGNDGDWFTDTALHKFVCTKFGVGDDGIPVVGGISETTNPAIRIHGCIPHELEFTLLVEVLDLLVLSIDNPHIIDREDNVRLLTFNDLPDALLTEWCGLESIGRRIHFEIFLLLTWITPPVMSKHDNIKVIFQSIDDIFSYTCKSGHGDDVTTPEHLSFFGH
jgi:hypothetical protein